MRKLKLTNGRRALLYILTPLFCAILCLGTVISTAFKNNKVYASSTVKQSAAYLDLGGSGKILNAFEGSQKENVYFGSYDGDAAKWLVLAKNDTKYGGGNNNLLLFAEDSFFNNIAQETVYTQFAFYGTSYARAYLNGGYVPGKNCIAGDITLDNGRITDENSLLKQLFDKNELSAVRTMDELKVYDAVEYKNSPAMRPYDANDNIYDSYNNNKNYTTLYDVDAVGATAINTKTGKSDANNNFSVSFTSDGVIETITGDKLFMLDYMDMNNRRYGFVDDDDKTFLEANFPAVASQYYDANGDIIEDKYKLGYYGYFDDKTAYDGKGFNVKSSTTYWLRGAAIKKNGTTPQSVIMQCWEGSLAYGFATTEKQNGYRPAFVLDTTKIAYATSKYPLNNGSFTQMSAVSVPEYKLYYKSTDFNDYSADAKCAVAEVNGNLRIVYNNPTGVSDGNILVLLTEKNSTSGEVAYQAVTPLSGNAGNTETGVANFSLSGIDLSNYDVNVLLTSANGDNFTETIYCSYSTEGKITAPVDVSGLTYDGNNKWVANLSTKPVWYDVNLHSNETVMTVSAITYKSMAEGATAVPLTASENGKLTDLIVDAGEYQITMALADGLKWADGSTDNKSFKITIGKKPSSVTPVFGAASTYVPDELPSISLQAGSTAGTIAWNDGETPKVGTNSYKWSFTPQDKNNYTEIKDVEKEFTFAARVVSDVRISEFKPEDENGDPVTVYTNTPEATLKSYLKVEIKYQSFANWYTINPADYTLQINNDNKLVTGDNTLLVMYNNIWSDEFTVSDVVALAYTNIQVLTFKPNVTFTYPVQKSDIIAAIASVATKRNDGQGYSLTEAEIASLIVIDEDDLSAGTKSLTFRIKDTEAKKSLSITIAKGTYDVADITLSGNKTPVYDGNPHALTTSGTVPEDVTPVITYKKEGEATASSTAPTDAGTYTVTLTFTQTDTTNYETITKTVTETVTIAQADFPGANNISFVGGGTVTHDGNSHKLEVTGVPTGVTVTYKYGSTEQATPFEFEDVNESGYTVTAIFSHTNPNYKPIAEKQAKLIITNKHTYNVSNLAFTVSGASGTNGAYTATYSPDSNISFTLGGKLVDIGGGEVTPNISNKYEKSDGNGGWTEVDAKDIKNAGTYRITATVTTGDNTYAPIDPFVATLTIAKANYNSVSFDDKLNVVYDGEEHTLEVTGTLSDGITATYTVEGQGDTTRFTEIGEYEFTVTFDNPDPENYNDMEEMTATLKIVEPSATGITATVESDIYLDVTNKLDDLKSHVNVTINLTGNNSEQAEDFQLSCATLRDGGLFEVGQQTVTVTYGDYTTTVTVAVNRAVTLRPVYSGKLSYTGNEIKPKAADFTNFDSATMTFVESKLQGGVDCGSTYKAVFALTDAARYEWASATSAATYSKKLFAKAVTFDGEAADIQLASNEIAVEWNVAKAVVSATKASSGLPVFKSESYKGSWGNAVSLRYYTDETCTTEVEANDLVDGEKYYAKVELVDAANFELDDSLSSFLDPFPYTKAAPALSTGDKFLNFIKANWLWLLLLLIVLLVIIIIVAICKSAAKKKREKEEERRQERMMHYMQTEGMPDYIPMMQSARMAGTTVSPELFAILSGINAKIEMLQNNMAGRELPPPSQSAGTGSASPELLTILNGMNAKIDKLQSDMAANEIASARDDRLRSEIKNAGNGAQSGVSAAEISQMVDAAVKNALAGNAANTAAAPARPSASANLGNRPLVQPDPIIIREPVDDDRVVDWGGFYNLADEQDLPKPNNPNKKK